MNTKNSIQTSEGTIKVNVYNITFKAHNEENQGGSQGGGEKARVMYWEAYDFDKNGTIRISAKDYGSQLDFLCGIEGTSFKNDSDIMTDYFCKDSVSVAPESPLYDAVLDALEKVEAKQRDKLKKREAMREKAQGAVVH